MAQHDASVPKGHTDNPAGSRWKCTDRQGGVTFRKPTTGWLLTLPTPCHLGIASKALANEVSGIEIGRSVLRRGNRISEKQERVTELDHAVVAHERAHRSFLVLESRRSLVGFA